MTQTNLQIIREACEAAASPTRWQGSAKVELADVLLAIGEGCELSVESVGVAEIHAMLNDEEDTFIEWYLSKPLEEQDEESISALASLLTPIE